MRSQLVCQSMSPNPPLYMYSQCAPVLQELFNLNYAAELMASAESWQRSVTDVPHRIRDLAGDHTA